jgi:hypothetical protein
VSESVLVPGFPGVVAGGGRGQKTVEQSQGLDPALVQEFGLKWY